MYKNFTKKFLDIKYRISFNTIHNSRLELLWNILPIFCLSFIAGPSFVLLYLVEDMSEISYIIKVVGNQWYWSYEFLDFNSNSSNLNFTSFDSVMLSEGDLLSQNFGFRLLEVNNRLKLMYLINTCFLVTSTDVLHSWAVPSLGLKTDACPGRINRMVLWPSRQGIFYGQCSEICGINHAYMPIVCVVE
jgi:heme/copper-type cytochrome/quinol oxidase subunit 2